MSSVRMLTAGAASAAAALALLPATGVAAATSCPEVPYTAGTTVQGSNYGAWKITASGATCAQARALGKAANGRGTFTSKRFRCVPRTIRSGVRNWTCTRPSPRSARVTFQTLGF